MKQGIAILCITLLLLGCVRSDPIHADKGTSAISGILDGDAGSNVAAEMKGASFTHIFRNGTSTTTPPPSSGSNDTDPCVHSHDTCAEVLQNCQLGNGDTFLINYYWIHYCFFGNFPAVSYVVLILWLLLVLVLLSTTADNYFVIQLETLSARLKLSPSTAGITLLALGNSAPDTFTDIASVEGGSFPLHYVNY